MFNSTYFVPRPTRRTIKLSDVHNDVTFTMPLYLYDNNNEYEYRGCISRGDDVLGWEYICATTGEVLYIQNL